MSAKIAIVTGANRGIGHAVAAALAEAGMRVVVCARSKQKAEAAVAEIAGGGRPEPIPAVLDVRDEDQIRALFEGLDRVDVLVNNAGTIFERAGAPATEVPAATVLETVDNNALSAYRMCQRALPMMNAAGYGRIVNVSSGMGGVAEMGGGTPGYRISKAALNAVTRIFHAEARGDVLINSVCPGWVRTDMGGQSATRSVEESVPGVVWAATLATGGPSGGFFRDGEPTPF